MLERMLSGCEVSDWAQKDLEAGDEWLVMKGPVRGRRPAIRWETSSWAQKNMVGV